MFTHLHIIIAHSFLPSPTPSSLTSLIHLLTHSLTHSPPPSLPSLPSLAQGPDGSPVFEVHGDGHNARLQTFGTQNVVMCILMGFAVGCKFDPQVRNRSLIRLFCFPTLYAFTHVDVLTSPVQLRQVTSKRIDSLLAGSATGARTVLSLPLCVGHAPRKKKHPA